MGAGGDAGLRVLLLAAGVLTPAVQRLRRNALRCPHEQAY